MDMLDLFDIQNTGPKNLPFRPIRESKVSVYNPWTVSLRIDNLPPSTQPHHITHMLTYVHFKASPEPRKREAGINMIQIYTLPRPSKTRKGFGLPKQLLKSKRSPRQLSISETQNNQEFNDRPDGSSISGPTSPTDETHLLENGETQRRSSESAETLAEEEHQNLSTLDKGEEEEDLETFAIIHFRNEYFLYVAKDILRHVTFDGRHMKLKTKQFHGAAVRRLVRRMIPRKAFTV